MPNGSDPSAVLAIFRLACNWSFTNSPLAVPVASHADAASVSPVLRQHTHSCVPPAARKLQEN